MDPFCPSRPHITPPTPLAGLSALPAALVDVPWYRGCMDDPGTITPVVAAPQVPPLASLPPWQLRYLIARQHSSSDNVAVRRAGVSVPIVVRETKHNPAFAALRLHAIAGTLGMDVALGTQLARDAWPQLVQHAIARATHPDVRDRDQSTWARLTGEAAGALGQGSQQAPGVQVIVALQTGATAERVRAKRTQLGGDPPSVDAPA